MHIAQRLAARLFIPTMSSVKQLFYGTIIHSLSLDKLHIIKNGLLGVDDNGKVVSLQEDVEADKLDSILEGLTEDSVEIFKTPVEHTCIRGTYCSNRFARR